MAKTIAPLLPETDRLLRELGERLRLARLRRRLQAKQVAERAGMTVNTLRNIERGEAGVTIGAYVAVMQVLRLEQDIAQLAKDDPVGRRLQDAGLQTPLRPRRTPKAKPVSATVSAPLLGGKARSTDEPQIVGVGGVHESDLLGLLDLGDDLPRSE